MAPDGNKNPLPEVRYYAISTPDQQLRDIIEIAEKALKRISSMGGQASIEAGKALNLMRIKK